MHKIDFANKTQFISDIKKGCRKELQLIPASFIIRYDEYEPFLYFFPTVISVIIMNYVHDNIKLNYVVRYNKEILYLSVDYPLCHFINYEFMKIYCAVLFKNCNGILLMYINKASIPAINTANKFMKLNHNQDNYIPFKHKNENIFVDDLKKLNEHVISSTLSIEILKLTIDSIIELELT